MVLPDLPPSVDMVVAAYNADMMGKAMNVARRLRLAGKSVDVYPEAARRVKKAFRYADKVGAAKIAFVAPDEWEKGEDLRCPKDTPPEKIQVDIPLDKLSELDSFFLLWGHVNAEGFTATLNSAAVGPQQIPTKAGPSRRGPTLLSCRKRRRRCRAPPCAATKGTKASSSGTSGSMAKDCPQNTSSERCFSV
eukprot:s938_g8.t1